VKRRTAHLAFGIVSAACALLAGYHGMRLVQAQRVNVAIATASKGLASSTVPEAQFAQAVVLARQGDYEGALQRYKALSRGERRDLAGAALYNTGNLHFRAALSGDSPDAALRRLPLLELAKQSYRAVLRRDPASWDARYNLERALWLAPEVEETMVETMRRNAEDRVLSTLQSTRGELP
jgi:mxaK protein